MKLRYVREGDEPDDDERVVRGGEFEPELIRADAQRMFDVYGTFGISVFALGGATIDELAQKVPLIRFQQLTVVAVGAIRYTGLVLEPTGRNPRHFTVMLDSLDRGIEALTSCEQQIWINPYHDT